MVSLLNWLDLFQEIRQCREITDTIVVLFVYSHHLTFWEYITIRRNGMLIISSWELKYLYGRTVNNRLPTVIFKTKKRKT